MQPLGKVLTAGISAASIALLIASPASAASFSWDQAGGGTLGGTGTWNTTNTNWWNGSSDVAWTDTTGTADTGTFAGTAGTVTVGTNLGALGLIFNTAGYTIASGTNTLTLGSSGIDASALSSGTTTISGNLALGANQSWNVGSGSALSVSAVVSGAFGITNSGSGTLTLSGANTYTGGTTVNAGVVSVANLTTNGNLGAAASGVTLNGGTLKTTNTAASTDTHVFTIGASGGTLNIAGTATFGQNSRIFFGTANTLAGSGALTVTGAGTLGTATGNNTRFGGAGALVLGSSATSTYSGPITLRNGGLIEVASASNVGTATITLGNEAEFTIDSGVTFGNNLTVSGGTNSVISFTNGAATLSGNVAMNANLLVGLRNWYTTSSNVNNAQNGTISGVISGAGNLSTAGSTVATTAVTLTMSGANTYTGSTTVGANTTIKAGVASVANVSGAFGNNSAVSLANAANTGMNITGFNTQIGSLTGGGATGGNVTLGAATLTTGGNNTSPAAYAGVISGTGAVTKIGTGMQTLSGANTYTGATTVSAGKLNVSGSISSSTGGVAINGGTSATLGGSGTVAGAVTVTNGSRLAPGTITSGSNFGSAGTLTLSGGLTLTSANMDFDLSTTASGSNDNVALGTAALSFSTLNFNFSGTTLDTTTPYTLISTTGSLTSGDVTTITSDFTNMTGGITYQPTYTFVSGTGLQVSFTAVPESHEFAIAIVGLLCVMVVIRRRKLENN